MKNALGLAGPGQHWHHIVEQTPGNIGRFGAEAVAHGAVQGAANDALGGDFKDGFLGGFAGSIFEPVAGSVEAKTGSDWAGTVSSAIVGGTVSKIGGGKFANGAASAAFVDMFNRRGHREIHEDDRGKAVLRVIRTRANLEATESLWTLSVDGTMVASGDGLEPSGLSPMGGNRVANGKYGLDIRDSGKFGPGHMFVHQPMRDYVGGEMTDVLIHPGNLVGDTQGCYLPGRLSSGGFRLIGGSSAPAVAQINRLMQGSGVTSRQIIYSDFGQYRD